MEPQSSESWNEVQLNPTGTITITITIIIPLFNGIEYLNECLATVVAQTYTHWTECLIGVNGHGEEPNQVAIRAREIVESWQNPKIRVINLPTTVRGAAQAINALVSLANTEWIAHLDADDGWRSDKLEEQVLAATGCAEGYNIIGTGAHYIQDFSGVAHIPVGPIDPQVFHTMNPLIHSSVLIKRHLAYYTDEFSTYDYDCWLRCIVAGEKAFNVPDYLTFHRRHSDSFYNASGIQDPWAVRLKYLGHR